MRKMLVLETVAVVLLALAAVVFIQPPVRTQMWVYPLVRQAAQAKLNYETREMLVYETTHFTIKYTAQDADTVGMVADAAERAYGPVTQALDFTPAGKPMVVIYPDRQKLNKVFGWSGDQSAMGVYWGGVIQVLSPHAWLKSESPEEFVRSGPMAHELTHLVLDYRTRGNYPRWFTEGLAQYVEYKVNGYEWRTANNSLTGDLYSLEQLDEQFDDLPNQALAYRESLAAVRYLAEGPEGNKLPAVVDALQNGHRLAAALTDKLGISYRDYETAWRNWAAATMI